MSGALMHRALINLAEFSSNGVGVLAGRALGDAARKKYKLDLLDLDSNAHFEIQIPEFIYSINSSFFLGMFADSIRALGESEFRRRFHFAGEDAERVLDDGIRKALRSNSPLPPVRHS
jgi:hypothetical protein